MYTKEQPSSECFIRSSLRLSMFSPLYNSVNIFICSELIHFTVVQSFHFMKNIMAFCTWTHTYPRTLEGHCGCQFVHIFDLEECELWRKYPYTKCYFITKLTAETLLSEQLIWIILVFLCCAFHVNLKFFIICI